MISINNPYDLAQLISEAERLKEENEKIKAANKELLEGLKKLHGAIDSSIELTPELLQNIQKLIVKYSPKEQQDDLADIKLSPNEGGHEPEPGEYYPANHVDPLNE